MTCPANYGPMFPQRPLVVKTPTNPAQSVCLETYWAASNANYNKAKKSVEENCPRADTDPDCFLLTCLEEKHEDYDEDQDATDDDLDTCFKNNA
jgi:hypothetical protein